MENVSDKAESMLLNSEEQETKKTQFFFFPFFSLPSFGCTFAHFNKSFLESSGLAYLDSQGSYTLAVGSSACATIIPGEKSHQSHRNSVTGLPAANRGKKGRGGRKSTVVFTTHIEKETIHTMLRKQDFAIF